MKLPPLKPIVKDPIVLPPITYKFAWGPTFFFFSMCSTYYTLTSVLVRKLCHGFKKFRPDTHIYL